MVGCIWRLISQISLFPLWRCDISEVHNKCFWKNSEIGTFILFTKLTQLMKRQLHIGSNYHSDTGIWKKFQFYFLSYPSHYSYRLEIRESKGHLFLCLYVRVLHSHPTTGRNLREKKPRKQQVFFAIYKMKPLKSYWSVWHCKNRITESLKSECISWNHLVNPPSEASSARVGCSGQALYWSSNYNGLLKNYSRWLKSHVLFPTRFCT